MALLSLSLIRSRGGKRRRASPRQARPGSREPGRPGRRHDEAERGLQATPAGREERRACVRVPHVCTRVHACARVAERGRAGRVGRQRASVREREKVDLEPKTRHEQRPKITQTRFARSLTRPFTDHEASLTATRSRPTRPHGAAGAAGPERSRSAGSRVHISFLNKTDIRLFCSSEANVTKTEFKL